MLKHIAILACGFTGFWLLARGVAGYGVFIYDEADYMYAASLGWKANAFDTPSMALTEFIEMGMNRRRDPGERAALSSEIRNSDDVLFYRHWHGPLYGYWLAMVRRFSADERTMRLFNYVFPCATAALLYFGTLWVLEGAAGQIAAILSMVLYLWSYPAMKTSEIAPHQLFALLSAAALLLLARLFRNPWQAKPPAPPPPYWHAAAIVCGLAFCVLEVAFVLILTAILCGWATWQNFRSLAIFAGAVLICWPAAALKLSFVKSYLFMAYLAVFRGSAWGPEIGEVNTWWLRIVHSPVPWALLVAAAIYVLVRRRDASTLVLMPFVLFAGLMFLTILRVDTDSARYELPLFPGVVLLGAWAAALLLAQWTPARRTTAVVLLCAATLASSWRTVRAELANPADLNAVVLTLLRSNPPSAQQTILIPHEHLPMVHYYLPTLAVRTYYEESEIPQEIRRGGIGGVITRTNPPRLMPVE
jgi:hypothetical protein